MFCVEFMLLQVCLYRKLGYKFFENEIILYFPPPFNDSYHSNKTKNGVPFTKWFLTEDCKTIIRCCHCYYYHLFFNLFIQKDFFEALCIPLGYCCEGDTQDLYWSLKFSKSEGAKGEK